MAEDNIEIEGSEEISHEGTENGESAQSRLAMLERNQALLSIVQDPDVKRVLELKRGGKKFVIKDEEDDAGGETKGEEGETSPEEDPLKDIPEDDPLRKVFGKIDALVEQRLKAALKPFGDLPDRLKSVEGIATTVQRKEVSDAVTKAKEKFTDFMEYRDPMLKLSEVMPGASVEELYLLAKHRAGKLNLEKKSTFSERPQTNLRRGGGEKKPETPPGRKGFASLLGQALGKLDVTE